MPNWPALPTTVFGRHRRSAVRARTRHFASAPVLGLAIGLAGCGGPPAALPPIPPATSTEYRLGPGDQIRLITFGEEQMTGEFRVDSGGDIALPLSGPLRAGGLTPRELETAAGRAMQQSGLLKNPRISVEVVAYRPFFILGEVNHPGQFPYQPGMTVVTAVAVAGGFTYRAIDDAASIVRTIDAAPVEGRAARQTLVQPGDVITIYERRF